MRRAVVLLSLMLAACDAKASVTPTPPLPHLGVSNGTTLTVTLVINGLRIAEYPAGGLAPEIDPRTLPPLPWEVEARSPSGRVLTSMVVLPGFVTTSTGPNGAIQHTGAMGRVDLTCGRLTIWAGDVTPSGPAPPASPGMPGDCAP